MEEKGGLRFDFQEDVDWKTDGKQTSLTVEGLTEEERVIYEAIVRRGACFMQSLNHLLPAQSPYDTLLSLMERGLSMRTVFCRCGSGSTAKRRKRRW